MTGFIVNVFPFLNRVSHQEAFEGLELGEGKPSRPVLRGPGGRKAAWLLGQLQIGRAYAMQGDTAKAKAAYQDFLTLWKDADPDVPIFIAAKAEYAKLK